MPVFPNKVPDLVNINKTLATKRDLRELESRVIVKVGAMIAASIAITTALVKLL